jgi:prephenate dehydratase
MPRTSRRAPTRYVYLGPEGTFSEQALRTLPETARGEVAAARSVPEALDAVRAGEADAALVPLEN